MGAKERGEILLSYTPDNYDAFLSHDSEQETELEKCPECYYCGQKITDERFYMINDEPICEDCLNENFQRNLEDYIAR